MATAIDTQSSGDIRCFQSLVLLVWSQDRDVHVELFHKLADAITFVTNDLMV